MVTASFAWNLDAHFLLKNLQRNATILSVGHLYICMISMGAPGWWEGRARKCPPSGSSGGPSCAPGRRSCRRRTCWSSTRWAACRWSCRAPSTCSCKSWSPHSSLSQLRFLSVWRSCRVMRWLNASAINSVGREGRRAPEITLSISSLPSPVWPGPVFRSTA